MKITNIETRYLEVPMEGTFYPPWAPGMSSSIHQILYIKIDTDEGISGYAATTAYAAKAAAVNIDVLVTPYLLGKDPFALEDHIRVLRIAHQRAIFAWVVECALWDIIGKKCGQPIYKLLGGSRRTMKAYACLAELRSLDTRRKDLQKIKDMGFKALKMRIHSETIAQDIEQVEMARQVLGPDIDIMCDANQAATWASNEPGVVWDYARALRTANELEKLGVLWLEEPLPKFDYKGLAKLCQDSILPIAGGESNRGVHEFGALIENHCYDIIQVDPTFSEGMLQLKKLQGMCEYYNIIFQPHSWTNGLGFAYSLHLAAASNSALYIEYPYDPPVYDLASFYAILKDPITVDSQGCITISDKPGVGYEINEEAIEKYTVR